MPPLPPCPHCGEVPNPKADPVHAEADDLLRCPRCRFIYPAGPGGLSPLAFPGQAKEDTDLDAPGVRPLDDEASVYTGKLELEARFGSGAARTLRFKAKRVFIGRENADIVIDDPKVSRRHAVIEFLGSHLYVKDLGSTNGTFLNDAKISIAKLHEGDIVLVGNGRLRVTSIGVDRGGKGGA